MDDTTRMHQSQLLPEANKSGSMTYDDLVKWHTEKLRHAMAIIKEYEDHSHPPSHLRGRAKWARKTAKFHGEAVGVLIAERDK